jgi:hypothetical protein
MPQSKTPPKSSSHKRATLKKPARKTERRDDSLTDKEGRRNV